MKIFLSLFFAGALLPVSVVAPAVAAPANYMVVQVETADEEMAAAMQIFERAAENYGAASSVKTNYTSVVKVDEDSISARGTLVFEAPARFRFEQIRMRDKTVFVYDGHSLMMQQNDDIPQRVAVRPNYTVWDELPEVSLPDPLIDSFLAGENPLPGLINDETQLKKLPDQTIGGAPSEGVSIVNGDDEDSFALTAWFNRETGLLMRVITRSGGATVTSNYSQTELDSAVPVGTFVLSLADKNNA